MIGVLYKSPSVRYGVYSDILEALAFLTTKYDHCVFLGDYNIDNLKPQSPAFKYFKNNILEPLSLTQMVKSPTRVTKDTSTLIDLILTNSPENIKLTDTADFPGISDHKLVYCSYSLKKPKFVPQTVKRRDFRKFAKEKFMFDVENVSWDSIHRLVNNDMDEAVYKFENIFADIINANAPKVANFKYYNLSHHHILNFQGKGKTLSKFSGNVLLSSFPHP